LNHIRITRLTSIAFLACLSAGIVLSAERGLPPPRAIRHSDVIFMYDNPDLYSAYGCTALGWAGTANPRHIDAAHAKGVRLFTTSVGFLTEASRVVDFSPDFLDAACRNFEGKPFIVPWLWDHKHKAQPAWWWCTNSPLYRSYLEQRLTEVAKALPDGLHIDDYRGTSAAVTWRSACFCRYCMVGFREYVGKNVSKQRLASLGITDLSRFDYREFLLSHGIKAEEYQQRRAALPLAAEFLDFQVQANVAFVSEYRRKAETLCGRPLALCVNSGLNDPQSLAIASQLSYFCCEVDHAASNRKMPNYPVYVYKLADGLNRPVASTASGGDWDYVSEHKLPGLVRMWIALSYAHGQNFMAPHRQWCYTKEKGTHWYVGPTEEYAWLYRFVRDNARLFDGYEAVDPVAVVYDNAAQRRGSGDIRPICTALAEQNIPFNVVVAGDDWLDYRLAADRLNAFQAVIVTKNLGLDGGQRDSIEKVRAAGRLVVWPGDAQLEKLVGRLVQIEGANQVTAVVRSVPGDSRAPLVIHLLNRRYAPEKDAMMSLASFSVRLRNDFLGGRRITKATLHAPRSQPVSAVVHTDSRATIITIPALDLWAVVTLE
jgi:hypothetical protein